MKGNDNPFANASVSTTRVSKGAGASDILFNTEILFRISEIEILGIKLEFKD